MIRVGRCTLFIKYIAIFRFGEYSANQSIFNFKPIWDNYSRTKYIFGNLGMKIVENHIPSLMHGFNEKARGRSRTILILFLSAVQMKIIF